MTDRPVPPSDPGRRDFFRRFAGDIVTSVGTVIGAAQTLQQESADAARELLGTGARPADPVFGAPGVAGAPGSTAGVRDAAPSGFRAAFRWDGDVCRLVDQRRLPEALAEFEVRGAADAATAINDGVVLGSPAQAQVAAIALALAAGRARASRPFARRAAIRGAANALRNTREGSAEMAAALDRMLTRFDTFPTESPGEAVQDALRDEAERLVFDATTEHGMLTAEGVLALPGEPESPVRVLTAGSTGALGGGQCGTALSIAIAAHHAGRAVHVLVAETRPRAEGSRVAAWELQAAGVSHAVVVDGAAPGLIGAGEVDAVLVAADRVAANGDVIAVVGSYPLALAASASDVPFLVCATRTSIDPATADGGAATVEEGRPGTVLRFAGAQVAPQGSAARSRLQDLVPARLVTAFVTGRGTIRPPFPDALAAAALVLPPASAAGEAS